MSDVSLFCAGPAAIADAIKNNGAMTKLDISNNKMLTKEAGKALADALASNSVLKELDVSRNNWQDRRRRWQGDGPAFAKELAAGVSANGALTSLNLASNRLGPKGAEHVAEAIKGHVSALRFD